MVKERQKPKTFMGVHWATSDIGLGCVAEGFRLGSIAGIGSRGNSMRLQVTTLS